jgi:putative zinc finger protein
MEHAYINEQSLIDRYVRGTLPVHERAAFEEHFLECQDCLDQLEIAQSLRTGIRIAAADQGVAPASVPSAAPREWVRKVIAWRWAAAIATACFVLALAQAMVFYRQVQHSKSEQLALMREVDQAKSAFERAPQTPPAVYVLDQSRGGEPVRTVETPRSPQWIVFTITIDTTQSSAYGATLVAAGGKLIWRSDNIRPASSDAIGFSVPSSLLEPGEYTLSLVRPDPRGSTDVRLARFLLHVVPGK